jgi:hemerythrin
MHKYVWIEKYSVGVKEIDLQHQHFFEIANKIIESTGQENISTGELLPKIKELADYSDYHFKAEEDIFKKYNYPDASDHIDGHDSYRKKMKQFIVETEMVGADVKNISLEIAEFAGSWLINHIMVVDQKYIGFMRENGIE